MKPLTRAEVKRLQAWKPDAEMDEWITRAQREAVDVSVTMTPHRTRSMFCIHASSVNNRCDAFLLLELTGAEPKPKLPPKPRKIMDTGTALHCLLDFWHMTRAKAYGYSFDAEVSLRGSKIAEGLFLHGSTDGRTTGWPLERPVLWEFKTTNRSGMSKIGRKPPPDYLTQSHVYMGCLEIPVQALTYFVKDTSETFTQLVFFDESTWKERVLKRITPIIRAANSGKEVARTPSSGCYYCPYYEACAPPIAKMRTKYGVPKL
jgi:hypothetical protein